jgi:dTDP-4-dehydrorhamnose reductase
MIHYSTDYVFDGNKNQSYLETDKPNPLGAYGRSKLAGDQAIQQVGGNHMIFRLCWVYGARGQNFMLTIMRLAKEREKLRVVNDQFGCPTWSGMIAQTTALALKQTLESENPAAYNGVYNMASTGHTSWHGFASAIVNLMPQEGIKCKAIEPITTPEYPLPAKRPPFSVLSCNKLESTFGLRLPAWEEGLKLVLDKIN